MSLPPWARLKSLAKTSDNPTEAARPSGWIEPPELSLEKHFKFYRDLLKSTEKVELSLAHSGKTEVLDSFEDPGDPLVDKLAGKCRVQTILVPLRFGRDPRDEFIMHDGRVETRPEYKDSSHLLKLRMGTERDSHIESNGKPSPLPSPVTSLQAETQLGSETPPTRQTPPPPPTAPPNRPPPPKAPPPVRIEVDHPSKKQRPLH